MSALKRTNLSGKKKFVTYLLRDGIIRLEPGRATLTLKESTTEAEEAIKEIEVKRRGNMSSQYGNILRRDNQQYPKLSNCQAK